MPSNKHPDVTDWVRQNYNSVSSNTRKVEKSERGRRTSNDNSKHLENTWKTLRNNQTPQHPNTHHSTTQPLNHSTSQPLNLSATQSLITLGQMEHKMLGAKNCRYIQLYTYDTMCIIAPSCDRLNWRTGPELPLSVSGACPWPVPAGCTDVLVAPQCSLLFPPSSTRFE